MLLAELNVLCISLFLEQIFLRTKIKYLHQNTDGGRPNTYCICIKVCGATNKLIFGRFQAGRDIYICVNCI